MAETTQLSATDVMSVRSRVSWSAIAAGAMIALAVYFLLTLLGLAIGLEVAVQNDGNVSMGSPAAIYSIFTLLLAMFLGGWAVSRLAVGESKLEAILYGVILWGVLFTGIFWLIGAGVRVGFGAMVGLASGAVDMADSPAVTKPDNGALTSLSQRYDTELGGQTFVDDLKKAGVEDARASEIQSMLKKRIEGIRSGSAPLGDQLRDAANDPETQRAAAELGDNTRRAVWFSLLGVVVSMVTVILGSLAGSGDLPIPVPMLYVRRTTKTDTRA